MKVSYILAVSFAFGLAAVSAMAEGTDKMKECPVTPLAPASADLARIKELAGKWEGSSTEGGKDKGATSVEYRVTSGGSAVEEKLSPGTPHEMVSMYHDVKGKLSMTHYCMLGNQPQLELKSSDPGKVELQESASSAALLGGQMRMNSLVIAWANKDHITQTWTAVDAEGKPTPSVVITLKRTA